MTFGRIAPTYTTGTILMASAGSVAELKPKTGGVTLDWTTVPAVSGSDVTFLDGTLVKVGAKGIPLGQVICKITATGFYGPYQSDATDGRQLLNRGDCFILNETVVQNNALPIGLGAVVTDHPAAFYGGRFFKDRVEVVGGQAAPYFGATYRPTLANFEAAFPLVMWVNATS